MEIIKSYIDVFPTPYLKIKWLNVSK
uniref:Uncharacterized protein n=1 Tax=Tetranychus urticae TaxID=32264 RepID=T1KNW6_TETUR